MIHSIRIQNFKSLRDVTLRLQDVNLLIGPNNSGKSNVLKALAFLGDFVGGKSPTKEELQRISYLHRDTNSDDTAIKFTVCLKIDDKYYYYYLKLMGINFNGALEFSSFDGSSDKFHDLKKIEDKNQRDILLSEDMKLYGEFRERVTPRLYNIKLSSFTGITTQQVVELKSDASNLMSYLDYLNNNHPFKLMKIAEELNKCVSDFKLVRTPQIDLEKKDNVRQVKLFDKNDIGFWADEVSEGTLYFLALLCIIFQPNPPSILMLEEPEKGIHPRRINEVMEYIFELAEAQGVQIILTSHSSEVVHKFKDLEEHIFVVDKPDNETTIKNLQTDIIDDLNQKTKDNNLPKTNYREALGEYWKMGLFGGVPA